jgi:hypothetical protein
MWFLLTRAACLVAIGLACACVGCGSGDVGRQPRSSSSDRAAGASAPSRRSARPPLVVADSRPLSRLPAAVQGAASVLSGGRVVVMGGLTRAGTSSPDVVAIPAAGGRARIVGALPQPVHDAAAVALGPRVTLLGGGPVEGTDQIVRVLPGPPARVGSLRRPLSDGVGVTAGGVGYLAGGWNAGVLDPTIYRLAPNATATPVGRLPVGVRYPAAAAIGDRILIAGGETAAGVASPEVWSFDPRSRRVVAGPRLPAAIDHAAGAALGGRFYVMGGLKAGAPWSGVLSWAPGERRFRRAGRLPRALTDAAAVATGAGIVLVGGRTDVGRVAEVWLLRARARR